MAIADSAQRMWEADSLITLLGKMEPDNLPANEGRALGECQARAVEAWLAAYIDLRDSGLGGPGAPPPVRHGRQQ